jgi:hypothetical protein
LVLGSVVAENGFWLFKAAKSENMIHRKIVALQILYRMAYIEKIFEWIIVLKTRLKVVGS